MYVVHREITERDSIFHLEHHKDNQVLYLTKQGTWQDTLSKECLFTYRKLSLLYWRKKLYHTYHLTTINDGGVVQFYCQRHSSWGIPRPSKNGVINNLPSFVSKEQALDFLKSLSKE